MDSIEDISDAIAKLTETFQKRYNINIDLTIYDSDIPFSMGFTKSHLKSKTAKIDMVLSTYIDEEYNYHGFKTMEAVTVLGHELNHAHQSLILYPSLTPAAMDLAVFDIVSKYIDEYTLYENAPFYVRNPIELHSELFGIKSMKYSLKALYPNDFSDEDLEKGSLDYINYRIKWSDGPWFFPRPLDNKYNSLSEFLQVANVHFNESFHLPIKLRPKRDGTHSKYMQYLLEPSNTKLLNKLAFEKDGLIAANTLSDIVSKFESTLKDDYFATSDIKFKSSLLNQKRTSILTNIKGLIKSFNNDEHQNEKTQEEFF